MKKIISGIMISLTIIISGLSISIMFMGASAAKNNQLYYVFGYSFSLIPTESMVGNQPDSLDPGDMVILKDTPFEDVQIGDVIVFQDQVLISGHTSNILIIHRVVDINDEGALVTKGDNPQNQIDPHPVTKDTYQGSLYAKITFVKPIVNMMLSSRSLIFISLIAVLLILVILELMNMYKTISQGKAQKLRIQHESDLEKMKLEERQKIAEQIKAELQQKQEDKNGQKD